MTEYFEALDGHDEPTLWARTDDPDFPQPVIRRRDVDYPGMAHHWDELVRLVTQPVVTGRFGRLELNGDVTPIPFTVTVTQGNT